MTGAISGDRESCQFPFCLMKNLLLYARERSLRVAPASGFRLLRSFGIDRLDAPGHAIRRPPAMQMKIQIGRGAKALDEGDRASVGSARCAARRGAERKAPGRKLAVWPGGNGGAARHISGRPPLFLEHYRFDGRPQWAQSPRLLR